MCRQVLDIAERNPAPMLDWGHVEQLKTLGLRDSTLWKTILLRIQHSLSTESPRDINIEQLWQDGLSADEETVTELMGQLIGTVALNRKKSEKEQVQPRRGNSTFGDILR